MTEAAESGQWHGLVFRSIHTSILGVRSVHSVLDAMNATDVRFSVWEIAFLQQPRNRELRDRVVRCLSLLSDLVQRYTGSMFLVMIPEEDVALSCLERALEPLTGKAPFEESICAGLDAYRRIRMLFEDQGLSPAVKELAQATADDLLRMWCWATSQPGFRLGVDERGWSHRTG